MAAALRSSVCCCFAFITIAEAQQHPCLPCHPQEVANFARSAMGNSLGVPHREPAGEFDHQPSGGHVRIYRKGPKLQHQITQSGLTADASVEYSVGFGKTGKSYLVELGRKLFQS